jgi:hypothetical protein
LLDQSFHYFEPDPSLAVAVHPKAVLTQELVGARALAAKRLHDCVQVEKLRRSAHAALTPADRSGIA